jgi:Peptidase family M28
MPGAGNRGVIWAVIGAALLALITATALRPSVPLGVDAPPGVFSAGRAFENLQAVLGEGAPHPIGSAANAKVRAAIGAQLSSLGYKVELQSGWACNPHGSCGYPINIIATLKAAPDSETSRGDAVLLAAHYDSVASGPGASDDGVGVASALEIARIMARRDAVPSRHPAVILISDGEEGGLLGAVLFVREHRLAKTIKAAVNMDSRGTSGLSLMFETGTANRWLMNLYARSVDHPLTNSFYYVIYKLLPNNTDFTVFKAAGYQGFNLAFVGNVGFYHTPLDDLRHASLATIQDQGNNALQAMRALSAAGDLNPPAGESVFFDVLGRVLVVWPTTAVFDATLILGILACITVVVLVHRGRTRAPEVVWGLIGFLVNGLLGGALCSAAVGLLFLLGKAPPFPGQWLAHPAAMSIAAVTVTLFAASIISRWLATKAGFWGLWCGATLSLSALSVAIAFLSPGPTFPWVLTIAAALLGVAPAVLTPPAQPVSQRALEVATLLPGLVYFAVLIPMLMLLYQGLGALAWPAISVALCMVCSFLLPLLAIATTGGRRLMLRLSGAVALGGVLITLWLPTFSTCWPQRVNVEYWLDADSGRAHWWVQPASLQLPGPMRSVANFAWTLQPRFPGISQLGFAAPAPAVATAAAHAELVSLDHENYELHIKAARDTDKIFVVFPSQAHIREATLITPQGSLTTQPMRLDSGVAVLAIVNAPTALRIGIHSAAPFSATVLNETYGLPGELAQGKALESARPENATSTQDGDVTVVGNTVR